MGHLSGAVPGVVMTPRRVRSGSLPFKARTTIKTHLPRADRARADQPPTGAPMGEVTRILDAIGRGEPHAADQLLPLIYDELRQLAAQRLAREAPGQTLDATALVHEAYLRVVGDDPGRPWDGRGHFFAAAAEAMRRTLAETARRRRSRRRGGARGRLDADPAALAAPMPDDDLLA